MTKLKRLLTEIDQPTTGSRVTIGNIEFATGSPKTRDGFSLSFLPVKILDGAVKHGITKLVLKHLEESIPSLKGMWTQDKSNPAAGLVFTVPIDKLSGSMIKQLMDKAVG